MMKSPFLLLASLLIASTAHIAAAQEIDRLPQGVQSRTFTYENPTGAKGKAASENMGAKGHAWDAIAAGKEHELLNMDGAGTVRRMWFTFRPFSPEMLRSLRLDIFWDHSAKPAVSVPFGDFFAQGLSQPVAFESALFSNPEGRSCNCYIPMPFRTGARVVLKNEGKKDLGIFFYDIDVTQEAQQPKDAAYFHAFWRRDRLTTLGEDYELLPKIYGKGRYLGATIGVQGSPQYGDAGWGEGEVKMYLDGDSKLPTIAGTGTEDYIGTAWGMGPFTHQYQGCTISDNLKHRWAFYRLHIPDPIYFDHDCRITIQDIGGDSTENVRKLAAAGAELIPVSSSGDDPGVAPLLTDKNFPKLNDPKFPADAWVNFFRRDDYSSVVYFYLDRPMTDLPPLPAVGERTADLR
jgi:hypothetical protein